MKKVSFLVAFLAFLQIASGSRTFGQQRLSDEHRRTVEEALDLAGDDVGQELEALVGQLGLTAEHLSEHLERWAEENSEELAAWSQKHSRDWEAWGERFNQKMERLGKDQENVWGQWAKDYEESLSRWSEELESADELAPRQLGEFVEQNLRSLSKMPLGQLVDQALEDGLGELSSAPWQSLEELGQLAQDAFEEPLSELTEILDEDSGERRSLEKSTKELRRALGRLQDDVERNISDSDQRVQVRDSVEDPRVRALKKLRQRENLSDTQRAQIDAMIRTIEDANVVRDREVPRSQNIEVPRRDQIKAKIEREKQRHEETLRQFNEDLRRSSEDSRRDDVRKSDSRNRKLDSRAPKRSDGKNDSGGGKKAARARQDFSQPFQRDARDGKQSRKPAKKVTETEAADSIEKSDLELLREEITRLREEVRELKKESDK